MIPMILEMMNSIRTPESFQYLVSIIFVQLHFIKLVVASNAPYSCKLDFEVMY